MAFLCNAMQFHVRCRIGVGKPAGFCRQIDAVPAGTGTKAAVLEAKTGTSGRFGRESLDI
jgi:hypothetical protein